MHLFYELGYRFWTMPWEMGPRPELVQAVASGRLRSCRAIDLGCGTGSNAVFLAQNGFDVTGVDFAHSAIDRARRRAAAANVAVEFVVDDLTNLRQARGPFDLVLDYGTFDDISPSGRKQYVSSVSQLAAPRAIFLLWCFEWPVRWWERHIPFFAPPLAPGEAELWFNAIFSIDGVTRDVDWSHWPPGSATYWMSRRP